MMGFGIIITLSQAFPACLDGCPGAKARPQDAKGNGRGRAGVQLRCVLVGNCRRDLWKVVTLYPMSI